MKTIIRIRKEDGTMAYVQHTSPSIKTTLAECMALKMTISQALALSSTLRRQNIMHNMITSGD